MPDSLKHRWTLVGRTAEIGNAPSEFSSEPVTHFNPFEFLGQQDEFSWVGTWF
jgi:hypothetical protein